MSEVENLDAMAHELKEVRRQLVTIRAGLDQVHGALLGDLSPDGSEGLVAKVRRADGLARGGRRIGFAAIAAASAGWIKDLLDG